MSVGNKAVSLRLVASPIDSQTAGCPRVSRTPVAYSIYCKSPDRISADNVRHSTVLITHQDRLDTPILYFYAVESSGNRYFNLNTTRFSLCERKRKLCRRPCPGYAA